MCNLYNLKASRDEVRGHFRAKDDTRSALAVTKDYVAPGKPGYVVREVEGQRVLSTMRWGFPFQSRLESRENDWCWSTGSKRMPYVYLAIAILAEVCATSFLKASDGFTRLVPTVVTLVGYGIAFYCLSVTLKHIPVGIAYAIWSGAGIFLIAVVAWIFYGQTLDAPAIIGMMLIVAGIIVMNTLSKTAIS